MLESKGLQYCVKKGGKKERKKERKTKITAKQTYVTQGIGHAAAFKIQTGKFQF